MHIATTSIAQASQETYIAPVYLGHCRPVGTVSIDGIWNDDAAVESLADLDALSERLEQLPRDPIRLPAPRLAAWYKQFANEYAALNRSLINVTRQHFACEHMQVQCRRLLTQHQGLQARIEALRYLLRSLS